MYPLSYTAALLFGAALATALLSGGSSGPPLGSPTPQPVILAATPTPAPTPTPTLSPTPAPTLAPCNGLDLGCLVRSLTPRWSPTGTTIVIEQRSSGGSALIAVPVVSGPPTPLVELRQNAQPQWAISPNGSAIAIALMSERDQRARIAVLDLASGTASWVTPDEPGILHASPVWSLDSNGPGTAVIYYAKTRFDSQALDLGVFRIRRDGTNGAQIRPPTDRAAFPTGITPDGRGVVLSQVRQGGSVDILDLFGGPTRTYSKDSGGADVASWRVQRPRALVICCYPVGPPSLIATWDDLNPADSRTIVQNESVYGASWDPQGTRLVAALAPGRSGSTPSLLVVMDPAAGGRAPIAQTDGAASPVWTDAGIVYRGGATGNVAREVRVVVPGGQTRLVFTASADILRMTVLQP